MTLLSYSGEFENSQAASHAKELVGLFCQQLGTLGMIQHPVMVARVCVVAYRFIDWAIERNQRALDDPQFKGTGDHIQIFLTTINDTAVQVLVADCGGKESVVQLSDIRPYADYTDYSLFNGGLLMRAIFKWRSC